MLTSGTRLGTYEVVSPLGAGGMGEVYRARDSKLNRDVAIKILPELSVADPDRVARFKREAQLLASLNHPNIGSIYGFEESDGRHALVLELIEGPTLADRIRQGPMPVDEALSVARQLAKALEAAHERGVIHRDLKPANIKLRPDGTVKVLDFGLAKAWEPAGTESPDVSQVPTIATPAMTQAGTILGTPAYMSPEQTRGKPVDKRADIWAFGCVLYEMLTGRSPFAAETGSDTIVRILEREPDWAALPAGTPTHVRELLRRCLQKDQQQRLQDIADAGLDTEEARRPPGRWPHVVGLRAAAAVMTLAIAAAAGAWWYSGRSVPPAPAQHAPVSVVIADLDNRTNDPIFDGTLEPMLRIVLEGAGFISAYDRARINSSLGVRPPETLDETAAREIAVKQGLGVVLAGALDREGGGYRLSVRAVHAVTGEVISRAQATAADKDRVLAEATKLLIDVRQALGDETSDSAQMFAMTSLSATSLEVVRHYAAAQEASSNGRFEEGRQHALKAVAVDPTFGVGYQLLAVASRNLGQQEDAVKYINEALRHLDGMTERERLSTRGMYFRLTGDYQQCVKEYGELITRYAADVVGHNQRALCFAELRNLPEAVNEIRQAVEILPRRAIFRINLALYSTQASDFQAAEREARTVLDMGSQQWGSFNLAQAHFGQGQLAQAAESYRALATFNMPGAPGASDGAFGLGELAIYEGRFSDAVRILEQGAAADLTSKNTDEASYKFAAIAGIHSLRGQDGPAAASARKALTGTEAATIRFRAARTLVEAGELADARTLMAGLASEVQAEPQAYAKIVEAEIALAGKDSRQAIRLLTEANTLLDTWDGHFVLGRAYLEAGQFAQADAEFDRCLKRRGELFMYGGYGYLPSVYYYQGRAREGLKSLGFAESYRTYLGIREKAGEDPLLPDVRRRAGL